MEAIVLALTPQPTTTTVSQNDASTGENTSPFAPLLNQAIAEKSSGSQGNSDATEVINSSEDIIDPHTIPQQAILLASLFDNSGQQQTEGIFDAGQDSLQNFSVIDALLDINPQESNITTDVPQILGSSELQATNTLIFSQLADTLTGETVQASNNASPSIPSISEQPEAHLATTTLPKQDLPLLLAQLQDIINKNETKGIVVSQQPQADITLDELANLTQQPTAVSASAVSAAISGTPAGTGTLTSKDLSLPDMTAEPSSGKNPTLRQEIQQQYMDGKINLDQDQAKNDGGSQSSKQDTASGNQSAQGMNSLSSAQGDQTSESVLFALPSQESGSTQQISQQGKVYTLPTGTMVAEQEVLNQVLQRFHMTNRDQSTRINLKLHPAELGELKINLTIKEGTIKASVVAQSQHVQEILEKNMTKLRSVLEQQGFVVEDIIVTAKSENVANFDLFGDQLPNRQDFNFADNRPTSAGAFEAALDSSIIQANSPEPGVNIRA